MGAKREYVKSVQGRSPTSVPFFRYRTGYWLISGIEKIFGRSMVVWLFKHA